MISILAYGDNFILRAMSCHVFFFNALYIYLYVMHVCGE